jgi:hypothetical protein
LPARRLGRYGKQRIIEGKNYKVEKNWQKMIERAWTKGRTKGQRQKKTWASERERMQRTRKYNLSPISENPAEHGQPQGYKMEIQLADAAFRQDKGE